MFYNGKFVLLYIELRSLFKAHIFIYKIDSIFVYLDMICPI